MFRAALQNVDLFWMILFYFVFESGCKSADVPSCHEVKTAYLLRQIGPVKLVPDKPATGQSFPVREMQLMRFICVYLDVAEHQTSTCDFPLFLKVMNDYWFLEIRLLLIITFLSSID